MILNMYRQIVIADVDRDCGDDHQAIRYRISDNEPSHMELLDSRQLAVDESQRNPHWSRNILRDFCVDDVISGADDIETLKWASNT